MAYRRIQRPQGVLETTRKWVKWAADEHLLPTITSQEQQVCGLCHGAVPLGADGTPYRFCYCCSSYRNYLTAVIPIVYSVPSGFEALVWLQKNEPTARWMSAPLGSLLSEFLSVHLKCIEAKYGHIDIFTIIPSYVTAREGWDHLKAVISAVEPWPRAWDLSLLVKVGEEKAETRRCAVDAQRFALRPGAEVRGQRVLVLDDTFTTGGTLASAAALLNGAGALAVIGLTLGRQLNADFSGAKALVSGLAQRQYDPTRCVLDEV